ncbi:hypothetical protein [Mucilaginibacter jinjuensis]|uniref:Cytochrome c family protein n=1 Tax=Mucilaginibacter jinjuensis TaxID=1176721 RepID=A0ABY7T459_9SPHI|nr:hypothetical protein [Mucilaginibacter jinjuensis]WCT11162.1 hypothetical protein PQO05_20700 [Mucilaginibacter jinjuensis]
MKSSIKAFAVVAAFGGIMWGGCLMNKTAAVVSGGLPQDVLDTCPITSTDFNTWFASGKATQNGVVTPANSVTFQHRNNCDFYQWSERMFLWLTSPAPSNYGGGGTVMASPVFYDVSPEDSAGHRVLIPHVANVPVSMTGHIVKNGPDRLPVIKDKSGKLFEVEDAKPTLKAKALVQSTAGAIEVDHVTEDSKGVITFLDKANNVIKNPKAILRHKNSHMNILERFAVGKKFVLLDANGNVVESEAGQATGDVLMDRNGSLVYYLSMVNDVYAWYLTGAYNQQLGDSQFPTTAGARDSICKIARANHKILPDSNALAMELKTSWVEASTLKDPQNYVTITAVIPTYDTTSKTKWVPNGHKTVKMAMIGVHIVGSVAGHPEMIWATFEQKNNTPNAAYAYVDVNHNVKQVPQDTGSHWLFNTNTADTPYNNSHMQVQYFNNVATDTIVAIHDTTISASNTLMTMPWGSAADSVTNPENKSSAASNSEVIAVNNSIQKLLVGNDIRKNYLFIGATWTSGGAPPNGKSYGAPDTTAGVAIGTNVLANTTMETYFQNPSRSCLFCHSNQETPSLTPGTLSHIYSAIQPLITMHDFMNKKKKK